MFTRTDFLSISSKVTRLLGKVSLVALSVCSAAFVGCSRSGPIKIGVQVIDGKTEESVAGCRVVVTVINAEGLKTLQKERFGLVADAQGKVNATITPSIPYTAVRLELCTPSGGYAICKWPAKDSQISPGDIASDYQGMYDSSKDEKWMTYERFSGAKPIGKYEGITFLGSAWDAYKLPHEGIADE